MQFLINTIAIAAISGLAALAFYPVLITNRAFILTAALPYLAGGYAYALVARNGGMPLIAVVSSIVAATTTSALLDWCIVRPFRRLNLPSWKLLIVTLGVLVIGQNAFSLLFGDDSIPLRTGSTQTGLAIAGGHISVIQLTIIILAGAVAVFVWSILNRTNVGRSIRGVFSNPDLAFALGHNPERIRLYAAILGGAIAGITGILVGLDTGLAPGLGFRLLLNGIVVILIVGMSGVFPIFAGALLLALLQNLAGMFWGVAWMESVAFLVLVALLIWRPYGLSGRRLRRIHI